MRFISFTKHSKQILVFLITLILVINDSLSQNINKYDLLISEIMCDPNPTVGLTDDEYLEIYNNSQNEIQLFDILITIGSKEFEPDSFILEPNSFIVFWDSDIPTLKNSGDSIKIFSGNGIIHRVDYNASFHASDFKENGGWSLELTDFNKPCLIESNLTSSENENGGTPGMANSLNTSVEPPNLFVESYFPINDSQLTVSFNLPVEDFTSEFSYKTDYNNLIIDIPKIDSTSIYSINISQAKTCFETAFQATTLNYGLPQPADSADVIINEILFNPDEFGADFIEIINSSNKPIDLSKLSFSSFDENYELEKAYPLSNHSQLLMPGNFLVFCEDKNWLTNQFPESKNIIQFNIPVMNNEESHIVLINQSGKILDHLRYHEDWHYSELNSNENVSLEKVIPTSNNDQSNWTSAASSVGYATPGFVNSNYYNVESTNKDFSIPYDVITPNQDSYRDQLILQYNLNETGWTGKIDILNYSGITIHSLSEGGLFGTNGTIQWNGVLNDGTTIKTGIYALWINAYNIELKQRIRQKITFYINGNYQ